MYGLKAIRRHQKLQTMVQMEAAIQINLVQIKQRQLLEKLSRSHSLKLLGKDNDDDIVITRESIKLFYDEPIDENEKLYDLKQQLQRKYECALFPDDSDNDNDEDDDDNNLIISSTSGPASISIKDKVSAPKSYGYKCLHLECGESFDDAAKLAKHSKKHELPFKCSHCPKRCVSENKLSLHLYDKHSNLKKKTYFQCIACKLYFDKKMELEKHNALYHGEGAAKCWKCKFCMKSFNQNDLNKYWNHQCRNISCIKCKAVFDGLAQFNKHICNVDKSNNNKDKNHNNH